MYLYNLFDLKYKTIRSWARAYVDAVNETRAVGNGETHEAMLFIIAKTPLNKFKTAPK